MQIVFRHESPIGAKARVSSVELSVVFSVEKMSVEKNMRLNSTIYNTGVYPGLHR